MTVRELVNKIGFKVDQSQMDNAEKKTKKMSLAMKAAIGGAVAGLFMLGKKAVGAAADMEMLTTQFEVMLGSTEKANAMMEKLKTFAAETPFQLNDLAKGSQQLLSFGVAEKDVINTMRMLGDTAGGNAEKLNGLVLAYGKVQTKGKASMEELNMMAERGLPILQILQKQTGLTEEAFFKAVSKGQISKENITQAFQTMTSSGGMFFEGMKKQSLTFHGLVSTMKDNFQLLLAEVGSALLPTMKILVVTLTKFIQGPLKKIIIVLAKILGPVLIYVVEIIGDLITILTAVVDWIGGAINFVRKRNKEANKEYAKMLEQIKENFKSLLNKLSQGFAWLKEKAGRIFVDIFEWILNQFGLSINKLKEWWNSFFNWFNERFGWIFEKIGWLFQKISDWFDYVVEKLKEIFTHPSMRADLKKLRAKEKEVNLKIKPPSISSSMQQGIKNNTANVNMTNNIGINAGGGIGSRRGAKKIMEQAARNVFTIELKKVLVNTGY